MEVQVRLIRLPGDEQGTPGVLFGPGGLVLHTLELPWKDNQRKLSCIPAGRYRCAVVNSPRFGRVYHVTGVPGRDAILIHSGNFAGGAPRYRTHVQGCILVGERPAIVDGQRAVLVSRPAVRRLMRHMNDAAFTLEIDDGSAPRPGR